MELSISRSAMHEMTLTSFGLFTLSETHIRNTSMYLRLYCNVKE
jgi:hypothetical protein